MAKIITPIKFAGGSEIAKNSLSVAFGDPIAIKSGYADKAVAGDTIVGLSAETKTFGASNQTTTKSRLEYTELSDQFIVEFDVAGGTISQANVGSLYNLNASSVVDGATAGTGTQLKLVKVLSTVRGNFVRAK